MRKIFLFTLASCLLIMGIVVSSTSVYACGRQGGSEVGHQGDSETHAHNKEGKTMSNIETANGVESAKGATVQAIPQVTAQVTQAEVGKPAPEFMTEDIKGEHVMLSSYKGKIVVLEWTNNECPYVRKHYDTGNMQKLQQEATKDGVVWISIVSSAKGKEGNVSPQEAQTIIDKEKAFPTYKILDESGAIGHLYGAKTTPHMFVIDQNGILAYSGAIDDNESFKPATVTGAKNYVREAIDALKAGKPVPTSQTQPYGCGVKY